MQVSYQVGAGQGRNTKVLSPMLNFHVASQLLFTTNCPKISNAQRSLDCGPLAGFGSENGGHRPSLLHHALRLDEGRLRKRDRRRLRRNRLDDFLLEEGNGHLDFASRSIPSLHVLQCSQRSVSCTILDHTTCIPGRATRNLYHRTDAGDLRGRDGRVVHPDASRHWTIDRLPPPDASLLQHAAGFWLRRHRGGRM